MCAETRPQAAADAILLTSQSRRNFLECLLGEMWKPHEVRCLEKSGSHFGIGVLYLQEEDKQAV